MGLGDDARLRGYLIWMRWDEVVNETRNRVRVLLANYSPVYAQHKDPNATRSTSGLSVEFWIQFGATEPLGLGSFGDDKTNEGERTSGILQVDVYRPIADVGTAGMETALEVIRQAMRGQVITLPSGGKVRFDRESPTPVDLGSDGRHWRMAVTCPFIADDL